MLKKAINSEPKSRRQVMKKRIKYIGLDVHKKSISIGIADEGRNGEVRYYGKIDNDMNQFNKFIRNLIAQPEGGDTAERLRRGSANRAEKVTLETCKIILKKEHFLRTKTALPVHCQGRDHGQENPRASYWNKPTG
jgi:hypothetical protein